MQFNKARMLAVAAAGVAVIGVVPGSASAAFDGSHDTVCENAQNVTGDGSTLQALAQSVWKANFPSSATACRSLVVTYGAPEGSGAGRTSFGANGSGATRDPVNFQFAGTDDAPTAAQLATANEGPNVSANGQPTDNDDAVVLTVPVAQGAATVSLHLPRFCQLAEADRNISASALEGAFAGSTSADQWSELFGSALRNNGGTCPTSARFTRVVRADSSGTTAQFKFYLSTVGGGLGSGWLPGSLANQDWPNRSTALDNSGTGNDGVKNALTSSTYDANGAIGYVDLATARSTTVGGSTSYGWDGSATDRFVWVDVEQPANPGTFEPPALDNSEAGTLGANCANVTYSGSLTAPSGLPAPYSSLNAAFSYADVHGASTTTGYPLCALTYDLAYAEPRLALDRTSATMTQGQARTVKDYLTYATDSLTGGVDLLTRDYAPLPSAEQTDASDAVAALSW